MQILMHFAEKIEEGSEEHKEIFLRALRKFMKDYPAWKVARSLNEPKPN